MMLHFETQDSPGLVALIWFSGFAVGLAVGLCINVYRLRIRRPLAPLAPLSPSKVEAEETLGAAHLSTLTVKNLKNELRDRNLPVTGVKEDLVKRLATNQKGLKETRK